MRRLAAIVAAALLLAAVAPPVAAEPGARVLPPTARPLGHSLVEVGTAWNAWALGGPVEANPLLLDACGPSPLDPKLWFGPEAIPGGATEGACQIPAGAMLAISPFFMECSSVEPPPWHGETEAELRSCVETAFGLRRSVTVILDGRPLTGLDAWVVTTRLDTLPAGGLLGPDPALTMDRGVFLVLAPQTPGLHTLAAAWTADELGLAASLRLTLQVS